MSKEMIFKLTVDDGSFDADVLKAKKAIEDLKKEKVLYDEKRKLGLKLTEEEIIIENKLVVSIKAHQAQLNSLNKITQLNTEAQLANNGSIDQATKQYKAAELELKRLGGTVERGADGILKLTGINKANEEATYAQFQTLKQYDAQLGKHNLNVGNYGSVLTKLKQQILDLEGQRTIANSPEEVMRLTTEIRKLTLQQDLYLGKVDEMGNRVAKNDIKDGFMDANGAVGALTSGMFLLTMSMGENSRAGEIMQKVMIGLTVAQTALSIAQAKADIAGTLSGIKAKANAAWNWIWARSVDGVTTAMGRLRGMLITTGIGALIVAVGVVISRMNSFKGTTEDNSEAQKELNDRLKENEKQFDSLADAVSRQDETLKQTIELREAQGASYKEIHTLNKQLLNDEIANIDKALQMHGTLENAGKLINRKKEAQNELKILDAEYYKEVRDNYLKLEKERRAEDTKRLDTLKLLTVAEKERLDQQIKATFIDNPNVQSAFQRLLGVDDVTFQEVWAGIGTTISESEIVLKGIGTAQQNVTNAAAATNDEYDKTLEKIKQQEQATYELGAVMSQVFQGAFASADDAQKKFYQNAIIGLLDYLEKFIMEKKIEALVTQLAGKGFVGAITGGIIVGLIDAAFSAAKNQITGFVEGGLVLPEHGIPIKRDNGDNRLATVKTGEVIMNETQQQRLKQAAGVDVFKRLGIPGFASGGVMDGGFAFRQATSNTNNSIELRNMVIDAVRSIPPSELYISDFERMQDSRNRAVKVVGLNR